MPWTVLPTGLAPGGFESISVGSTAAGLSETAYKPASGRYAGREAQAAFLTIEDGDVRWRQDGSDPTAAVGHYLIAGKSLLLQGAQAIYQFRAICATGISRAVMRATYLF